MHKKLALLIFTCCLTLLPRAQAATNKVMVITSLENREKTEAAGYQGLLARVAGLEALAGPCGTRGFSRAVRE